MQQRAGVMKSTRAPPVADMKRPQVGLGWKCTANIYPNNPWRPLAAECKWQAFSARHVKKMTTEQPMPCNLYVIQYLWICVIMYTQIQKLVPYSKLYISVSSWSNLSDSHYSNSCILMPCCTEANIWQVNYLPDIDRFVPYKQCH